MEDDDNLLALLQKPLTRTEIREIALRMMMHGYSLNRTCERMGRSRESIIELLDRD
jgi:hypothetical protein